MANLIGKRHVLNLCYPLAGDIFFQKNPPPGSVGSNLKHSEDLKPLCLYDLKVGLGINGMLE
jgi:hypothetical protein